MPPLSSPIYSPEHLLTKSLSRIVAVSGDMLYIVGGWMVYKPNTKPTANGPGSYPILPPISNFLVFYQVSKNWILQTLLFDP